MIDCSKCPKEQNHSIWSCGICSGRERHCLCRCDGADHVSGKIPQ
nr:MAG TPA: hypothetical protein [Caudoviricetes sp.]